MTSKFWKYFGIFFIILGAVLLFNSFSGITGFVVFEDVKKEVSGILGAVFVIAGIGILTSRTHHVRFHDEIAARLYEILGTRNAYGHKTEEISVMESRIAAHGSFDKREVKNVIKREIESGKLCT